MTRFHGAQSDRAQQRTLWRRLCVGRRASRTSFHVDDVLSSASTLMQPMRQCACRLRAFALHFALHGMAGLLRVLAHARVRPHVQMACPERAMPMAWTALAGGSAAPCAAPPGHRLPVPSGRGKMQGKIKGAGTLPAWKRVCTWGGRGTRHWAAPCRKGRQRLVRVDKTACLARLDTIAFAGAAT